MDYMPHTDGDRKAMLSSMGLSSVQELFPEVHKLGLHLKKPLAIPPAMTEQQVRAHMESLASHNALPRISLLGAGAYAHYTPSVVRQLLLRGEFYTAYTPYQAEVSQGTLTTIFEFQTYMARLTGMDVANASVYDGATAMVEAAFMAHYTNKRTKFVISSTVHPHYRQTLRTYMKFRGFEITQAQPFLHTGQLKDVHVDNDVAALIVQTPNFFGVFESLKPLADKAHAAGALLIVVVNEPVSLSMLDTSVADIVCGEAQPLGNATSYGGPYVGFMCTKEEHLRRLPGRIVGKTKDTQGNEGFILTLQAREQHIRREKATSNICTNQNLCALATTIFLSTIGREGLRQLGTVNHSHAYYLAQQLKSKGIHLVHTGPFFNEFVIRIPHAKNVYARLLSKGIEIGYPLWEEYPLLNDTLLLCVTELHTKAQLDEVVRELVIANGS